jgi:uncharacterized membrane protein YpjA
VGEMEAASEKRQVGALWAYWRMRDLVLYRPVAMFIIFCNLIGSLWGFTSWYGETLLQTPWYALVFVPDCPLYALLFVIPLTLIMLGRSRPWINALVAVGLVKYGIWTVFYWVVYWSRTADFNFISIIMTLTHAGMILEGLFLLSFLRMDWPTALTVSGWFLLNDWVDYGRGYHPSIPWQVPLAWMQGHTVAVTAAFAALYAAMASRRRA